MLIVSSQTCSSYSSSVSSSSSLSSSSSSSSCLPFVSLSSETHFFWGSQLSIIIRTLCLRVHCPLSFSFLSDIRSPFDQSSEERLFLPRQWQVPLHLTLNRVELRLFLSKRNLRIFYDLHRHVRSPISLCSSASSTFPPNSNHNYQPRFLVNDCVSR